jgi:hypothetical protein
MLHRDRDAQACGTRAFGRPGEECVLDCQRGRGKAGMALCNLTVRVEHGPYGAIADRVGRDLPPMGDGELDDLGELLPVPLEFARGMNGRRSRARPSPQWRCLRR